MCEIADHPTYDGGRWRLLGADGRFYDSPRPGTLGGHRRTRIYGRLDCRTALRAIARGGYVSERVFFADAADAIAAGYRPCAVCLPEDYARWKADSGAIHPTVTGAAPTIVLDGLGFPESTRWHDGRVWLCNWGSGEVLAATAGGDRETIVSLAATTLPFSIDWLPDGRLLVVDGPGRRLLRHDGAGTLQTLADLGRFGDSPFNELVVDGRGNAYVNGGQGLVVCVRGDGTVDTIAEGLRWPNGMALIEDDRTLVVADSHAEQLIAFDVAGRSPAGRRVWAELEHAPDGICADADGAIWVATVPGERCMRVGEGGEVLDTVSIDRGCFACMLGGEDGRTLYIAAARWRGMEAAMREGPGDTGRLLAAPGQPAAHAGRP